MSAVREILDAGDNTRIINPGIDVSLAFTVGIRFLVHSTVETNPLLKVGRNDNVNTDRGFTLRIGGEAPNHHIFISNAGNLPGTTGFAAEAWHDFACSMNGGISAVSSYLNGSTGATGTADPPPALSLGDGFILGMGGEFFTNPDNRYALGFYLQGVVLTALALAAYFANPCALIAHYGPSGSITPNALKVFQIGACAVDLAQGNTVSITGTTVEDDATDYATTCVTKSAALSGTMNDAVVESEVVAGGKTSIITLTGDTFVPA
jgi:hypothetical protein